MIPGSSTTTQIHCIITLLKGVAEPGCLNEKGWVHGLAHGEGAIEFHSVVSPLTQQLEQIAVKPMITLHEGF